MNLAVALASLLGLAAAHTDDTHELRQSRRNERMVTICDATKLTNLDDMSLYSSRFPGSKLYFSGSNTTFEIVNEGTPFYYTNEVSTGHEPWSSDGTSTSMIQDVNAEGGSSSPWYFTPVSTRTFFSATDREHGRELWVTDEAGTRLVKDIEPGGAGFQ